eukprot:scaffold2700_cov388-Prasinococcus_capsulatus_cf.AAC.7
MSHGHSCSVHTAEPCGSFHAVPKGNNDDGAPNCAEPCTPRVSTNCTRWERAAFPATASEPRDIGRLARLFHVHLRANLLCESRAGQEGGRVVVRKSSDRLAPAPPASGPDRTRLATPDRGSPGASDGPRAGGSGTTVPGCQLTCPRMRLFHNKETSRQKVTFKRRPGPLPRRLSCRALVFKRPTGQRSAFSSLRLTCFRGGGRRGSRRRSRSLYVARLATA